jgi:acid phosphatase
MTTLVPRPAYTEDELRQLYPANLRLHYVQILLRHGERSPVSPRFANAGLPAFWPYCSAVRQMRNAVLDGSYSQPQFTTEEWKRRLETFGPNDEPVVATGPRGEVDSICDMGMLTDKGRETTFNLGTRLRGLYVNQLGFLPTALDSADGIYLRATPIPRALESLQETFLGLYPLHARAPNFPPPTILIRSPGDETLFPNDSNCRRFARLSRAFADRAARRWNDTDEMAYLNKLWGKWMPEDSPRVAVDAKPRLSGIMDTINATLAHGPETRLPKEFYDKKGREIMEKIGIEEWFAGYKESREYRMLGIGGLLGDVVSRMVGSAEKSTADGEYEVANDLASSAIKAGKGAAPIRFGLSGCHDTTLAGVLASLGAFEGDKWPPFTSHIAVEMFKKADAASATTKSTAPTAETPSQDVKPAGVFGSISSWVGRAFGRSQPGAPPPGIGRKRSESLTADEKGSLDGYYVRLRYNDAVVKVPGCKPPGKHLDGDDSFCTLVSPHLDLVRLTEADYLHSIQGAFKAVVDKLVPDDWRKQCTENLSAPAFPEKPEPAGY